MMRLHRTECTGMKCKLPVETVAVCDIWSLARERRAVQVKEVFNRVFVSVVSGRFLEGRRVSQNGCREVPVEATHKSPGGLRRLQRLSRRLKPGVQIWCS